MKYELLLKEMATSKTLSGCEWKVVEISWLTCNQGFLHSINHMKNMWLLFELHL